MNERLKNSVMVSALSDVAEDLADLLQKEVKLAKAEFSEKLTTKLRAGLWLSVTAALAIFAALVLIEAAIFAIASYGLALHWSSLIVAAALMVASAGAYAISRADVRASVTPTRTLHQVRQDVAAAKENLS
jgi:uncharacterized membrane protein YqjE